MKRYDRRCLWLAAAMVVAVFAVPVVWTFIPPEERGSYGNAPDAQHLPFAGTLVSELAPEGAMRYKLEVSHIGYVLVVSGRMDADAFARLKSRALVDPHVDATTERKNIRRQAWDEGIIADFPGGIILDWPASEGYAKLYYRPPDGVFTLVVRGGEEKRKQWFPHENGSGEKGR